MQLITKMVYMMKARRQLQLQIFFEYEPEAAARVFPNRQLGRVTGPLLPQSFILTAPSLYGYIGCSCLPEYSDVVTFDSQGEIHWSMHPWAA